MLDMTNSIAPRSDQMNADDLMTGPRTFTIAEVKMSDSGDQPVDVYLVEFPADRPFKPSKSMRRVMVVAWGRDASTYVGRRMTLYRDPEIRFGGQDVGGIRISHMDGIEKPIKLALTVTKGKRSPYTVQRLEPAKPVSASDKLSVLNMVMTEHLGLGSREEKLTFLTERLGRDIASAKDVTEEEAVGLLRRISEDQAGSEA